MNTEQKVLLACFALYTVFTFASVLYLQTPSKREPIPFDQKERVETTVFNAQYRGTWVNKAGKTEFLDNNAGMAKGSFVRIQTLNFDDQLDLKLDTFIYLIVNLYDPQFRDEKYIRLIQPIAFDGPTNVTLRPNDESTHVFSRVIWQENLNEMTDYRNSSFNGSVVFAEPAVANGQLDQEEFQQSDKLIRVQLKEDRPDGLDLLVHLHVSRDNPARTSLLYAYFMVGIAILNYIGAQNLFASIFNNFSFTKRLAMPTILLVCLQDCLVFLINIQLGMNLLDAWSFMLVIAWYFILFCFIDYRLLLYVWRYQNHREFDELTEQQFRNKLYVFQMKVYLVIILYLVFMWHFFLDVYLVLANSLVLVPQIVHHIRAAEPPTFNKSFLLLFAASKYLIFLYFRGCPHNILGIRYFYFAPLMGLAVLLASLLLLHHQENYGSRGFLPKLFKGDQFEYWVEMAEFTRANGKEQDSLNQSQDDFACCICLSSLLHKDNNNPKTESEKQLKSKILNRILKTKGQKYLMKTPCQHVFHADCLMSWMDVKMECPHCRTVLPQII